MTELRTIHEKPVSSQHPDEHQHNREGEGKQLGQCETPTAAKRNPAINEKRHQKNKQTKKRKIHRAIIRKSDNNEHLHAEIFYHRTAFANSTICKEQLGRESTDVYGFGNGVSESL